MSSRLFVVYIPYDLEIEWDEDTRETHIDFGGGITHYSFTVSGFYTKDQIENAILFLNQTGQLGQMPNMLQSVLERNAVSEQLVLIPQ